MSESIIEYRAIDEDFEQFRQYFDDYQTQLKDLGAQQIMELMMQDHLNLGNLKVRTSIPDMAKIVIEGNFQPRGGWNIPNDLSFLKISPENYYRVVTRNQEELKRLPPEQATNFKKTLGRVAIQTHRLHELQSFKDLPPALRAPPFRKGRINFRWPRPLPPKK